MNQRNDIITHYVSLLRKILDSSQSYWTDWDNEVKIICNASEGDKKIGFILDALYLLEDTQLAKENYLRFDLTGPTKYNDFGEMYLRMYGIYNACYLQKQAILTLLENIISKTTSSEINNKIQNLEIFQFRDIFASHTTNYDYREKKHSFILSRHDLKSGRIMGYSSNKNDGIDFKDGILSSQIEKWDCEATKLLHTICEKIIVKYNQHFTDSSDKEPWDIIFNRIQKLDKGESQFAGDIFDINSIEFNFVSRI